MCSRPLRSCGRTLRTAGIKAVPLDQVIEANNASNVGLKKWDVQLARCEDIMNGRVSANRVKVDELRAQVTLVILDAVVEY